MSNARAGLGGMLGCALGSVLACVLTGGCSQPCHDRDGDGRGSGCAAGPDCNDNDPLRAADCDAAVPNCAKTPYAAGCPCQTGEQVDCYEAPADTEGVGACAAGYAECNSRIWSVCQEQMLPQAESCNGRDDDCDGLADEGVLSPCGGCNSNCVGGIWGAPIEVFHAGPGLEVTADGALTLARSQHVGSNLWVANTGEGTVSKLDTTSAKELARYRTAGGMPMRVAVDHRGDAWVLDQSQHAQAMLTKLAGSRERCAADGGGVIHTSQGPADVLPLGQDDCVLLSVPVGALGSDPRALAIDGQRGPDREPSGDVWLGMAAEHEVVELDGVTGTPKQRVALPGFSAYTASFDPWGRLWLLDRGGRLASIDLAATPPVVTLHAAPLGCFELEAFAIDAQGRLVLSGFSCEHVITFDPRRKRWRNAPVPDLLTPRGVTVRKGAPWLSYTSGQLGAFTWDPLAIDHTFELAQGDAMPYESIAVAVDDHDKLWVISASGAASGMGLATRFDPATKKVTAQVPVGSSPRALGDLTGAALGGEATSTATLSHVFEGCGHEAVRSTSTDTAGRNTRWVAVHVDASYGPGASLAVAVRHASSKSALATAKYVELGSLPADTSPLPLALPEAGVIELRLTLAVTGVIGAPLIERVGVEWHCPGPE